jgi:hypothetical protein
MILNKCLDNWIFFCAKSPLKGIPMSDWRAGVIPVTVEAGFWPHLANAECAPSLVHFLLLVSLAGSKGSVDDAHPLILLRYTRRLQVMQPELWPKARSILSRFLETFPRDIIHGQKVAYDIRRCAKCIIFENEQT